MTGAAPLTAWSDRLQRALRSPERHLRRVMDARRVMFRDAFATSGASTGRRWPVLEPRYAALQRALGDDTRPLHANRPVLEPSFQGGPFHVLRFAGRSAMIGSSVPWARHVASGGTNPVTGERFPPRDPTRTSRSQRGRLTDILMGSIRREVRR